MVSFRGHGRSKDPRPGRPQVVNRMAVAHTGIPIRVWAGSGRRGRNFERSCTGEPRPSGASVSMHPPLACPAASRRTDHSAGVAAGTPSAA